MQDSSHRGNKEPETPTGGTTVYASLDVRSGTYKGVQAHYVWNDFNTSPDRAFCHQLQERNETLKSTLRDNEAILVLDAERALLERQSASQARTERSVIQWLLDTIRSLTKTTISFAQSLATQYFGTAIPTKHAEHPLSDQDKHDVSRWVQDNADDANQVIITALKPRIDKLLSEVFGQSEDGEHLRYKLLSTGAWKEEKGKDIHRSAISYSARKHKAKLSDLCSHLIQYDLYADWPHAGSQVTSFITVKMDGAYARLQAHHGQFDMDPSQAVCKQFVERKKAIDAVCTRLSGDQSTLASSLAPKIAARRFYAKDNDKDSQTLKLHEWKLQEESKKRNVVYELIARVTSESAKGLLRSELGEDTADFGLIMVSPREWEQRKGEDEVSGSVKVV